MEIKALENGILRLGMNKLVADTEESMILAISEAYDLGYINRSPYGIDLSYLADRGKFYCVVWR